MGAHLEAVAPFQHLRADEGFRAVDDVRDALLGQAQIRLPRLNLGHVQHVVDESEQVLAGGFDLLRVFPNPLRIVRIPLEQIRKAHDGVHRRADVVGHVGQKRTLGVVRRVRHLEGLLRRMLRLLGLPAGGLDLCAVLLLLPVELLLLPHAHGDDEDADQDHRQRKSGKEQRLDDGVDQDLRVGRHVLRGYDQHEHPVGVGHAMQAQVVLRSIQGSVRNRVSRLLKQLHAGRIAVAVGVGHVLQDAVDVPADEDLALRLRIRRVQLRAAGVHQIGRALPAECVRVVSVDDDRKVLDVAAVRNRGLLQRDGLLQPVDEQDVRRVRAEDARDAADALPAVHQRLEVVDHALLARGGVVSALIIDGDGHEPVRTGLIDVLKPAQIRRQLLDGFGLLAGQAVPDELRRCPLVAHEQVHAGVQLLRDLGHLVQALLIDQFIEIVPIGGKRKDDPDSDREREQNRKLNSVFLRISLLHKSIPSFSRRPAHRLQSMSVGPLMRTRSR